MKIIIDTKDGSFKYGNDDVSIYSLNRIPLYSKQAFEMLTDLQLKVGWNEKIPYTYSWLGFPILQIPDDMIRMQEVIFRIKPDVIVETGVAHGGSLIFYASLLKLIGKGLVIGIEKGLICQQEVESNELSSSIILIEGDSTSPNIVSRVHDLCEGQKALVILDSNHSKNHVAKELEAYHDLVPAGSYIVATDGNMKDLHDVPRGNKEWLHDNPQDAALDFVKSHPEFVIEQPPRVFNESELTKNVTYWPNAWLRRT